jgi:methyl-accepting chemotaxis protein
MKKKKLFRTRKLVDPRYQLKFGLFVVFFLLVYSLIFGTAMFFPLAMEMKASTTEEDQARIAMVVLGLHEKIWPSLTGVLSLAFLGAILYSHRIVGPLVRLRKTVDNHFSKGDFTKRIRFRKSDELKELEGIFNSLADHLEQSQASDRAFHAELKQKLEKLQEQINLSEGPAKQEAKEALVGLAMDLEKHPVLYGRQP